MISFRLDHALAALRPTWSLPPSLEGQALGGVSTDTRSTQPGDLFVAIRGPQFDGSSFVGDAVARGAAAIVMEDRDGHRDRLEALHGEHGVAVAVVPDAVAALGALATAVRSALPSKVLAITGSCGKTSTKRVVDALLSASCRSVASPASFNNEIGVPHTVFMAEDDTDVLVLEVGTNGPGEIESLAAIARPDVAVITNIGRSHLERLVSVEGVAREKSELFRALDPRSDRAAAVVNLDDPMTPRLLEALAPGVPVVSFSRAGHPDATFRATEIRPSAAGTRFDLHGPEGALGASARDLDVPLLGAHAVSNVLAALAAIHALGADVRAALGALPEVREAPHRFSPHACGGVHVIDDAYNANPTSMAAALEFLGTLEARRFMVIGAMGELGEGSDECHLELGARCAAAGLERLVLVEGDGAHAAGASRREMSCVRDGAAALGDERISLVATVDDAVADLALHVAPGDAVLVKASRAQRLERVVEGLLTALRARQPTGSIESIESGGVHA